MTGPMIATATGCMVFLRALQQQNVIHRLFLPAILTSFAMAFAEVALIVGVIQTGFDSAVWIGAGGAVGVSTAMAAHPAIKRWFA